MVEKFDLLFCQWSPATELTWAPKQDSELVMSKMHMQGCLCSVSGMEEVMSSDCMFWAGMKSDLLLGWPMLLGYLMCQSYQWLSGFCRPC